MEHPGPQAIPEPETCVPARSGPTRCSGRSGHQPRDVEFRAASETFEGNAPRLRPRGRMAQA